MDCVILIQKQLSNKRLLNNLLYVGLRHWGNENGEKDSFFGKAHKNHETNP